jgi:hypothetical protein
MLTLGLGHTAGITFLAKSTTGRKLGRGSFKDIFIYNINIIFSNTFFGVLKIPIGFLGGSGPRIVKQGRGSGSVGRSEKVGGRKSRKGRVGSDVFRRYLKGLFL